MLQQRCVVFIIVITLLLFVVAVIDIVTLTVLSSTRCSMRETIQLQRKQRQLAQRIEVYKCQQLGDSERDVNVHYCMRARFPGLIEKPGGVPVRQ